MSWKGYDASCYPVHGSFKKQEEQARVQAQNVAIQATIRLIQAEEEK